MTMPSWKTLDKAEMKQWEDKLEAVERANSDEQKKVVGEYYQYLVKNNHAYGNLAYQASQNTGFAGRLANKYLKHIRFSRHIIIHNTNLYKN